MDERVETLLAETLGIPRPKITDDLAMADLDVWDSLKHMELIGSLEDTFGVQLTFEEIVGMRSVREIKRILKDRGALA